jgi:catechol 2,3-dioxygenase-like lactoylglutathione lyase family enzyme
LDAHGATVLLLFARTASKDGVTFPGGWIPPHDGAGPAHIAFAIDAADLATWESRLAAANIAIESRVTWTRGGTSVYFRDPEGHSVELATPGVWPTY